MCVFGKQFPFCNGELNNISNNQELPSKRNSYINYHILPATLLTQYLKFAKEGFASR